MSLNPSPVAREYWCARWEVGGAFWDIDFLVFDRVLSEQENKGVEGDLLEIGAAYGKSAIVLGLHAKTGEETIVCDIFEETGVNTANTLENQLSYPGLNRSAFETNYLRWVGKPPRIVQELSSSIPSHVRPGSLRFAHLDGGHHYDVVSDDVRNTRKLLLDTGVLVFDDFRAFHTPGVAAAAWEAVAIDHMIPFCATEQKLYATWNPATAKDMGEVLADWVKGQGEAVNAGIQEVAGHELLLIANPEAMSLRNRAGRARRALRSRPKRYLGRPL